MTKQPTRNRRAHQRIRPRRFLPQNATTHNQHQKLRLHKLHPIQQMEPTLDKNKRPPRQHLPRLPLLLQQLERIRSHTTNHNRPIKTNKTNQHRNRSRLQRTQLLHRSNRSRTKQLPVSMCRKKCGKHHLDERKPRQLANLPRKRTKPPLINEENLKLLMIFEDYTRIPIIIVYS